MLFFSLTFFTKLIEKEIISYFLFLYYLSTLTDKFKVIFFLAIMALTYRKRKVENSKLNFIDWFNMLNFNGPLHESLIWFLQILLQAGHPWSSWWQAIGLQVWTKFPWMERLKECYWCISQIPRTASIPCEIEPPWHAQLSSYDEMWHAQEERKEQGTDRTSKIRRDEVGIELVPKMLWMCSSKQKMRIIS